jgi:ribose transport system substrate-binding protein
MRNKIQITAIIVLMASIIAIPWLMLSRNNDNKPVKVGISNGFIGNNWRNQMLEDLNEAITYYKQIGKLDEVIVKNAGEDVNNQILQIRYLIDSNVDILLINPNSPDRLNDVIDQAIKAGITVIVYDQNTTNQTAVQMTIDQYDYGLRLAEWLIEELNGTGNIIIVSGVENQPCNTLRVAGIRSAIDNSPNIQVLEEIYGNWDQATARKVMTDALSRHPDIDAILTQDGMALGIIQAYEAAGRKPPVMCGETMNAYIEKSLDLSQENDFKTFALSNPPGIGASALSLGLWINDNFENPAKVPFRQFVFPVQEMLIENGKIYSEIEYEGGMGTEYHDEWFTIAQIEEIYGGQINASDKYTDS